MIYIISDSSGNVFVDGRKQRDFFDSKSWTVSKGNPRIFKTPQGVYAFLRGITNFNQDHFFVESVNLLTLEKARTSVRDFLPDKKTKYVPSVYRLRHKPTGTFLSSTGLWTQNGRTWSKMGFMKRVLKRQSIGYPCRSIKDCEVVQTVLTASETTPAEAVLQRLAKK